LKLLSRLIRPILLIACLALAGCAPQVKVEQPIQTSFIRMEADRRLGQTFTSRYKGLDGIALYLKPDEGKPGDGLLTLHLRPSPQSTTELGRAQLALKDITRPGFYRLDFSPIQISGQQDYFIEAALEGNGSLEIGIGPGSSYPNGALYLNDQPMDAQLSFRLAYDRSMLVAGLILEGLNWIKLLAAAAWLFLLPGWGLAALFWKKWQHLRWPEKLGVSAGLSISLYPILYLWASLVGLPLRAVVAWLLPISGLAALILANWRAWKLFLQGWGQRANRQPKFANQPLPIKNRLSPALWPDITYVILLALVIFTRFWTIRTLDLPLWGDSYQHTMIAQLLVDHGGLFNSWAPYADLQSFTYHFGFHTLAAATHWLTGLNLAQATLWTGQILNILAAACLYPLAVRVWRSPWAGVLAVVVAGLLAPMPMFYVNWGRYTQLAGQVILPVAMYLVWELVSPRPEIPERGAGQAAGRPAQENISNPSVGKTRWRQAFPGLILGAISLAGLSLTHYRILIFAALFILVVFIFYLQREQWRSQVALLLSCGILAGLLALPWYVHIYGDKVMQLLMHRITTPASQVSEATQQFNAIGDLYTYLPWVIWALLLLSVAWAIWKRNKAALMIVSWWLLVLLAANPQWLGLPGTGAIGSFTVLIAAYIPAGLLIGAAGGWMVDTLAAGVSKRAAIANPSITAQTSPGPGAARITATVALITAGVLLLGLLGARLRLKDVHAAQNALALRPDLRAADWLQANTPPKAHFLVNSFFAFGNSLIAGSDGGLWLPLLAGRSTTLPPINYTLEQGPRPDYVEWINSLTAAIQAKGLHDPQVIAMLKERGITHVYIGQQQGNVNSPGPLLDPAELLSDAHFRMIYHQDRVYIFEFLP
jgi:hypothetical protein